MRSLPTTTPLTVLALLVALGGLGWASLATAADDASPKVTSRFKVEGMTCGGCELGVKLRVKKLEGVDSVDASYKKGEAEVVFHPEKVTPDDIVAAIVELGYTAELQDDESGS